MAIITCPTCKKQHSDRAPKCPYCKNTTNAKPHINGTIALLVATLSIFVPYIWATIMAPAAIVLGVWATSQKQKKYGYIAIIVGLIGFGWTTHQGYNIQKLVGGNIAYTQQQKQATPQEFDNIAQTSLKTITNTLEIYFAENMQYPTTIYDAMSHSDLSPGIMVDYTVMKDGNNYSITCYHLNGSTKYDN